MVFSKNPLVVVQNNRVEQLTGPAAQAARYLGITLHDLSSGEKAGDNPLPQGGPWDPILVVGSLAFVKQWAGDNPDLTRWIFRDEKSYDPEVWSEKLGPYYLNHDGVATTVAEYQSSDLSDHHIRPRFASKLVGDATRDEETTGLIDIPGFVGSPPSLALRNIDLDTAIWVSPVKKILAEVRVWVIHGYVVAASMYRLNGEKHRTTDHTWVERAIFSAQLLHRHWSPGIHYVVDLAQTREGMKVIEYNSIHASGWYAANPEEVVKAFFQEREVHGTLSDQTRDSETV